MSKIALVVEDDINIADLLRLYLEKDGFEVFTAPDGGKGVSEFERCSPDMVLLDIMLPGMDGNDICREIRKNSDVPIIMLTARTDTLDKIIGLELGADDYVPKPFEPKELLARAKAVLRRSDSAPVVSEPAPSQESSNDIVEYPGLIVDKKRYVVTVDGNEIYMPPKELELLFFLASNPNRVFNREQLLENVWGYENFVESRTVDVHVKRIREKIETPEHMKHWLIKTIWSVGYKFEAKQ